MDVGTISFGGGMETFGNYIRHTEGSLEIKGETNVTITGGETIYLEAMGDVYVNESPIITADNVNSYVDVSLPESATFKSLIVGGNDSSASASSSVNFFADEVGLSITKNNSVIDVNEDGVDIQSSNIHLAADNGVLSVTAVSWPVLTIDNSSG